MKKIKRLLKRRTPKVASEAEAMGVAQVGNKNPLARGPSVVVPLSPHEKINLGSIR